MAVDRIVDRVARWLSTTVKRLPDSAGGPATMVQVCTEQKRNNANVVTMVDLGVDVEQQTAAHIADAITDHADGVGSRGMTFYLYALNATKETLLAAFPVKVTPEDVPSTELVATAKGPPGSSAQYSGDVVTRAAVTMLSNERSYTGELAKQNVETLKGAADMLTAVQQVQGRTAEILQQQATALLEQLRLSNERVTELATSLRAAERERDEFKKLSAENFALAEQAIERAEKLEKDKDDRENGPLAQMKKKLMEQVAVALGLEIKSAADSQVKLSVATDTSTSSSAAIESSSAADTSAATDTSSADGKVNGAEASGLVEVLTGAAGGPT